MSKFVFADRMKNVSGEAVKEILAMMADPNITSFGGGSPAKESFPVEVVKEIINETLTDEPFVMLQYGQSEGYRPLREAYIEHLVLPKGVKAGLENVITLTGSTQGFDLVTQVFINPGDVVLLESPTFLTVFNVLGKLGAKLVAVETDENGIKTDDLEEKIKAYRPKMLYAIPTFQNPTGRTLPAERRKRIAELSEEHNFIVVEDDPYCELRYQGTAVPPIKSFDKCGNVVMINSFSKIVSPGIRVGALTADAAVIARMLEVKQCCDTHTANLTQAICSKFLTRGLLPGHIKSIQPMYLERMQAMLNGIEKYFPAGCTYTKPDGGLFTWVKLPWDADTRKIVKDAVERIKVAFVPGSPFFLDAEQGRSSMRINFSSNTPERISVGIKALGELLQEHAAKK